MDLNFVIRFYRWHKQQALGLRSPRHQRSVIIKRSFQLSEIKTPQCGLWFKIRTNLKHSTKWKVANTTKRDQREKSILNHAKLECTICSCFGSYIYFSFITTLLYRTNPSLALYTWAHFSFLIKGNEIAWNPRKLFLDSTRTAANYLRTADSRSV